MWEDNIKMYIKTDCEGVDSIQLFQDSVLRRVLDYLSEYILLKKNFVP
jgi:hypothetical protein